MRASSAAFGIILSFVVATQSIAEFRIATIDMGQIVNASAEAKDAKAALDAATEKAKAEIDKRQAAMKPLQEKAKSGKLDQKSAEAQQLRKQTQELFTFMSEKEDELKAMFAKSNRALTEKTIKAVEKYAKENDINMVLDKSEGARSPVLYGESGSDITEAVTSLLKDS